ncbi:MAG: hypothetical protein F6J95_028900 [Leptolyngbya sp. SIO1E4]|nr:hypothetical protein [Leptolyngbya sp. SIO1E4]
MNEEGKSKNEIVREIITPESVGQAGSEDLDSDRSPTKTERDTPEITDTPPVPQTETVRELITPETLQQGTSGDDDRSPTKTERDLSSDKKS